MTADINWIMVGRSLRSLSQGYLGVIVPLYLLHVGFTAVTLGEFFTIGALVSTVMTLLVSILADQVGRRPFLAIFPLFTMAAAIIFPMSHGFWPLLIVGSLGTLTRGGGAGGPGGGGPFYPAQQALIADHSPAEARNQVFTAFSIADAIAGALGGALAALPALLVAHFGETRLASYEPLFVLTAVLSLFSAVAVLPIHEHPASYIPRLARPPFLPTESRRIIGLLAVTNLVNGVGIGFFAPFIVYWFNRRYGTGSATLGALFAAVSIGSVLPYLFAPWLARTMGVVRAVVAIRMVGVVSLAVLPFLPTFPLAAIVYFLRMSLQRASIPLRQSYTMGIVAASERSSAAGISNVPSQLAMSVSPLAGGYLFDTTSLELPFTIAAALQFLNAILFFLIFRKIKPPEERDQSVPTPPTTPAPPP